ILSYLSFSVPVIIAGVLVNTMGLALASYWYGGVLMLLAAAALIGTWITPAGLRDGALPHKSAKTAAPQ
ncbi:MAG: hypothetical protein L0H54_12935, partial [Alcaligenaceae bacterium]|nr:hypothetical protein [Alcaligenaceae bacterium]